MDHLHAGDHAWTDYRLSVNVTIHTPTPKIEGPVLHNEFDRYLPRKDNMLG